MGDTEFDAFEGPKLLIERAKENLADFNTRRKAFFAGGTSAPVQEIDAESGEVIYKRIFTKKIPSGFRTVLSDAVNNLRHALDQAVSAAAASFGADDLDGFYFPFVRFESELAPVTEKKCGPPIPGEVRALIKAFKPYLGGDDALYALSKLSGINKHQIVLGISLNVPYVDAEEMIIEGGPGTIIMKWDGTKNEYIVARLSREAKLKYKFKTAFEITFTEGELVAGQQATAVLNTLIGKVEGIVMAIEAETARLLGK